MRCVRPTCAHLWMNGQPSCRAVPEAEHLAELARSDGDSRRRACFGRSVIGARWGVVFPTARVTSRLWCLSSASSGPRAISRATHHACEHAGRNRPRPTRAPCLVKARGLLGRGHLRSGGSRPLERPRVSELCNRSSLSCASALRLWRTRSRHQVASRGDASLVFATDRPCCRTTCLLAPLCARIAWMRDSMLEGREKPFGGGRLECDRCAASPKTPASEARTPAGKPSESRGCPPTVRRRGT
jgi:hypothetical protein